jgi:5,10-methylenetetrahydrofolate reductase
MTTYSFEIVCEIEPPTRPDLKHVRHQIGTLSKVADTFLIPDNHLGRATVSSVAVAHEVEAMGGRSIACLNSRDRNLLGLRRDLLTAAAYGVDQFLFVYGDKPSSGGRTGELTVRAMIEEVRALPRDTTFAGVQPFRVDRLAAAIPDIDIPAGLVEQIASDRLAGVEATCEHVLRIRDSGAFDGVHLIPVTRYREVAARLENLLK